MTTADWALVISIGSLGIALLGLAWNVWSKFIYPKPRVQVSFQYMTTIIANMPNQPVISLGATNHGPIGVTLKFSLARRKRKTYSPTDLRF
jgi:hypothetical protein